MYLLPLIRRARQRFFVDFDFQSDGARFPAL